MRVAVLDIDQNHNLRLKTALVSDGKVQLVFTSTLEDLTLALNGQPENDEKLKRLEKTLVDGAAMFTRASDGIQKATQLVDEKKAQLAGAPIATAKKLEEEVKALNVKIDSARELKTKIEAALATRKKEIEALRAQIPAPGDKKFDLVLVDRAFLGNLPSDWLVELRAKLTLEENKYVPVIAMGYNEDLNYIKQTLHGGVRNYFVKPVDQLLLHQTLQTGSKVFELQTEVPIRVLKTAIVRKMSEFELDLECDVAFRPEELIELYVDIFGGEKDKRVLARCEKSAPGEKGVFISTFMIVGHTPHTMTEMRKWIRARYVNQKKEEG